jgi:hypothetical protein
LLDLALSFVLQPLDALPWSDDAFIERNQSRQDVTCSPVAEL